VKKNGLGLEIFLVVFCFEGKKLQRLL